MKCGISNTYTLLQFMWSQKYKYCQKCGTTKHKYIARGLCENCYNKDIESRHKPVKRTRGKASKELSKPILEQLYIHDNLSLADIAKLKDCSRQYINKKMKEYNIPTRSKSAARELALRKEKLTFKKNRDGIEEEIILQYNEINDTFFSKWSSAMAYVLGVIATDGCIVKYSAPHSKRTYQRLSIDQKEKELLNKILFLMKSNIKIYKRINNENDFIHTIQITNDKIVNELLGLGITERKSNTLVFPNIPKEYVRHFIRGCWDGDGSIYKSNNQYRANYISGSLPFISQMVDILKSIGLEAIKIFEQKTKNNIVYYFTINGNYYCTKLFYYLYYNVKPEQYLERKYNLFVEAVIRNTKKEEFAAYKARIK